MTDLISRQAAIDEIKALYEWHDTVTEDRTIDHLKRLPSADVEPVKTGKWLAIGNTGLAACSCGYITDRYSIYNYCPNCGARMEADNEID